MIFKSKTISIRLTPDEYKRITDHVTNNGLVMSDFVRWCIMSKVGKEVPAKVQKRPKK